jgi:hypothetical protein
MNKTTTQQALTGKTIEIQVGEVYAQFNPTSGRVTRRVRILEIRGEAAIATTIQGKNKGETFPISLEVLA